MRVVSEHPGAHVAHHPLHDPERNPSFNHLCDEGMPQIVESQAVNDSLDVLHVSAAFFVAALLRRLLQLMASWTVYRAGKAAPGGIPADLVLRRIVAAAALKLPMRDARQALGQ